MTAGHDFITAGDSPIHSQGVFAQRDIPKGARVIEYIGEKISRADGDRREKLTLEMFQTNPELGAVYIFELDDEHDLDGNFDYNVARLINHACDPNCKVEITAGHIWIVAQRDIKAGEEISFNYGYDWEYHQKHPSVCCCGSPKCVGYILDEDYWPKLKE